MSKIQNFNKFKFKPFEKRTGHIAVRNYYQPEGGKKQTLNSHNYSGFCFYEIVKYQENHYYGKENEYTESWGGEFYERIVGGIKQSIDKNCFKNKETCYVLAWFEDLNNDEYVPKLKFCSERPFNLNMEEREQFWQVAEIGYKEIVKQLEKLNKKYNND